MEHKRGKFDWLVEFVNRYEQALITCTIIFGIIVVIQIMYLYDNIRDMKTFDEEMQKYSKERTMMLYGNKDTAKKGNKKK